MTRGKQKIEAQRRNAERNQKPKGSQLEARAVALKVSCPICKYEGMNGDVRLCFTPEGFSFFTPVLFSVPPCNIAEDLAWSFDNDEGEDGEWSALLELDSGDSYCGEGSTSTSGKAKGAMELGSCLGRRNSCEDVISTNARPDMVELRSHAGGLGLSKMNPAVVELGSHVGEDTNSSRITDDARPVNAAPGALSTVPNTTRPASTAPGVIPEITTTTRPVSTAPGVSRELPTETRPFSGGEAASSLRENPHYRNHDSPRTAGSGPRDISGPPGILSNGPTLHGVKLMLSTCLAVDQRVVEVARMERGDRDTSVVQGGPANIASTRSGDVAIQRREARPVNPNKEMGQDVGSMVGLNTGPLNKINPIHSMDLAKLYFSFVSHGPPLSPTMFRAPPILGHDSGPLQGNQIQDDTLNLDPFRDPSRPSSEPNLPPNSNWGFLQGIWKLVSTKFTVDFKIGPNLLEGLVLLVEGGPVPLGVSARIYGNGLFVGLTSGPKLLWGGVYEMSFDPIGGSTLGFHVGFDDIVRPQTELSQGTSRCGRPKKPFSWVYEEAGFFAEIKRSVKKRLLQGSTAGDCLSVKIEEPMMCVRGSLEFLGTRSNDALVTETAEEAFSSATH